MAKKKKKQKAKAIPQKAKRKKGRRGFVAFLICLVVFAGLAYLARWGLFTTVKVESGAMPGYKAGDLVIVSKVPVWQGASYTYGDVVYASTDNMSAIREIWGLPGDYLEQREDGITLIRNDGKEVYLGECSGLVNGHIPPEAYLLCSEDSAKDSRTAGLVSRNDIIGKPVATIWPLGRIGKK